MAKFCSKSKTRSLVIGIVALVLTGCAAFSQWLTPPPPQLTAQNLAVIVNTADPLSQQIANYYQQQRHIPAAHMIAVQFPPSRTTLEPLEFYQLKQQIETKLSISANASLNASANSLPNTSQNTSSIQGYALTWTQPYRVGCMSITSAFTFGFDTRFCADRCTRTQANPYFNQEAIKPFDQLQMRPTMAIAATSFAQAKALIDRGVAADGSFPAGTAYLMRTSDKTRTVRESLYPRMIQDLGQRFALDVQSGDALRHRQDVMFYFTGLPQVTAIETNQFRPGAIADHLTSMGGMLTDSPQMSSLRWLEAGATGSYGAVAEPCNFLQKFPHPGILMHHYLAGDTLLEAYWKSVAWPGQGIFIGEPLARPFGRQPG